MNSSKIRKFKSYIVCVRINNRQNIFVKMNFSKNTLTIVYFDAHCIGFKFSSNLDIARKFQSQI